MLILLAAAGSMALKDALGTMLVVAESKGRALLAGALDAGSDLAVILTTVVGAGQVIAHGWTARTVAVLVTMMIVSFAGTAFWTRVGSRMKVAGAGA